MRPRTPLTLLSLAVAVLAAAGCGGAGERDQVRDVAQRFSEALAAGDGARACAQLDAPAREALVEETMRACPESVLELGLEPSPVTAVRVYVTNAQVELADGELAYLGRAREGWRLSAVGCRFADGKPRSRPATCELEA